MLKKLTFQVFGETRILFSLLWNKFLSLQDPNYLVGYQNKIIFIVFIIIFFIVQGFLLPFCVKSHILCCGRKFFILFFFKVSSGVISLSMRSSSGRILRSQASSIVVTLRTLFSLGQTPKNISKLFFICECFSKRTRFLKILVNLLKFSLMVLFGATLKSSYRWR